MVCEPGVPLEYIELVQCLNGETLHGKEIRSDMSAARLPEQNTCTAVCDSVTLVSQL